MLLVFVLLIQTGIYFQEDKKSGIIISLPYSNFYSVTQY